MKINLEQLEEMQVELFKKQCDLDIQKAMVKHFIKKKKDKQLTLTDVSSMLITNGMPSFGTKEFNDMCSNFFGGKPKSN